MQKNHIYQAVLKYSVTLDVGQEGQTRDLPLASYNVSLVGNKKSNEEKSKIKKSWRIVVS